MGTGSTLLLSGYCMADKSYQQHQFESLSACTIVHLLIYDACMKQSSPISAQLTALL